MSKKLKYLGSYYLRWIQRKRQYCISSDASRGLVSRAHTTSHRDGHQTTQKPKHFPLCLSPLVDRVLPPMCRTSCEVCGASCAASTHLCIHAMNPSRRGIIASLRHSPQRHATSHRQLKVTRCECSRSMIIPTSSPPVPSAPWRSPNSGVHHRNACTRRRHRRTRYVDPDSGVCSQTRPGSAPRPPHASTA